MSTALVQALEELARESATVGAGPDPDTEVWKEYGRRREAIFLQLRAMKLPTAPAETERAARLMQDILRHDAAVMERIKAKIAGLREEFAELARMRRALNSYGRPPRAPLFDGCA